MPLRLIRVVLRPMSPGDGRRRPRDLLKKRAARSDETDTEAAPITAPVPGAHRLTGAFGARCYSRSFYLHILLLIMSACLTVSGTITATKADSKVRGGIFVLVHVLALIGRTWCHLMTNKLQAQRRGAATWTALVVSTWIIALASYVTHPYIVSPAALCKHVAHDRACTPRPGNLAVLCATPDGRLR